jgi:hypothetical protein
MALADYLTCRFCGKKAVYVGDRIGAEPPDDAEVVHSACLDVALSMVEGEHIHQFAAKGVRRRGTATFSIGVSDTEILWRCVVCGTYEVETVPGVWTKQQLGLPDAIETDSKRSPVPSSFPAVAAGAVAMSKETARQAAVAAGREQAIARQEAARGGPGPTDAPED